MAKYKPWLVCCSIAAGLVCAVALVYVCVTSFVERCPRGAFPHAAVAADSLRCSEIGRNILRKGGSAVDGAIAALLCTSVVNPQSMGIGGGSIVTIGEKTGNVKVFNFRESVPRSFKPNLLEGCRKTFGLTTGSEWIGVPGELLGYHQLHRLYGKLPWAKLFEDTINLARTGFPLPPFLGNLMQSPIVKNHVERHSICQILCDKNKTILKTGDTLKFPQLADTLEVIAQEGAEAFYSGKIGQDLVQDVKEAGGTLDMVDLKSYKVLQEEAWMVPLGDAKMFIPQPPSGGALLAFILKMMEGFNLSPKSLKDGQKVQMYHRYVEAAKFANGQRKSIRDPLFHNNGKTADHLIDPSFINRIRQMISNHTHDISYYSNVKPSPDHVGTTHVSVLDEDGLAVSATSTINQLFGGGVYSPKTGIILNNELSDFCGRVETVRAGERPPSSMTPVILETKSGGLLVIGGSGGSMITTGVAMSVMNRLWLGMNLTAAIAHPIVFVDSENNLKFEPEFDETVKNGLRDIGHKIVHWPYFFNVVNAVEKENSCIMAVSDHRKLGTPAGY